MISNPGDHTIEKIISSVVGQRSIRLGKGVVGKLTNIALGALLVLFVLACKTNSEAVVYLILAVTVFIAVFFAMKIVAFSDRHPEAALLEGAEFLEYKKHMNQTGKFVQEPLEAPMQTLGALPDPKRIAVEAGQK